MFMLEAVDSHEKAKNKSIMPTHSQTIPAKNNRRLFVTAGLYLSIFLIMSSVFCPNQDREESHDDALALLLTFGAANTWYGDFHPTSSVPCPAHTIDMSSGHRLAGGWNEILNFIIMSQLIVRELA